MAAGTPLSDEDRWPWRIELIRSRLGERHHRYMPVSLLESQFAALEPPARCVAVDVAQRPERCVNQILAQLD